MNIDKNMKSYIKTAVQFWGLHINPAMFIFVFVSSKNVGFTFLKVKNPRCRFLAVNSMNMKSHDASFESLNEKRLFVVERLECSNARPSFELLNEKRSSSRAAAVPADGSANSRSQRQRKRQPAAATQTVGNGSHVRDSERM
jgi:hypothetical protein